MEEVKITSSVTVGKYREFKADKDRDKIADMIYERFSERYIEPFKGNKFKHGFSMIASSCIMIESLYCFQRGRKRTGQAGGEVFEEFFSSSTHLKDFAQFGQSFYRDVRCGILHQGETYGGWKIRRIGQLFDSSARVINANKFLDAMEKELKIFTNQLKSLNFHRKPWVGVIRKLDYICENCNT